MHAVYVEVSDEITTVIERIKKASDPALALVVPRGALILQSIVNLKLARKAAADLEKDIVLVTTDKVGRNLATQVGIPVVNRLEDAESGASQDETAAAGDEPKVISGVRIHRYYEEESGAPEGGPAEAIEPIIPKNLLSEKAPASPEESEEDIPAVTVRPIDIGPLPPPAADGKEAVAAVTAQPAVEIIKPGRSSLPIPEKAARPAAPAPRAPHDPARRRKAVVLAAYLVLLLILGAAGVGAFYLPATTITVTVPAQPWEKEFTAQAKTGSAVSAAELTFPAEVMAFESTGSLDFQATGSKNVGEAAKGTATLYNYDSTSAQTVPAGAKLVTGGISFTSQEVASVPGFSKAGPGAPIVPGSQTVSVVADEAGETGNVTNAPVNNAKGSGYSVSATVTASGGTTRQVAVMTATDIANAKASLGKKLREEAEQKQREALQSVSRLGVNDASDTAFSTEGVSSTVASGAEAASGQVSGRGTLKVFVATKDALQELGSAVAATEAPKDGQLEIEFNEPAGMEKIDLAAGTAVVHGIVRGHLLPPVDTALLRAQLAGKKPADGEALIKAIVKDATVTVTQQPSWWPNHTLPWSPRYLRVETTYND